MNLLVKSAEILQSELEGYREYLHQNPELGMNLPLTSNFVFKTLEAMGCAPIRITDSGIMVLLGKGGENTKTVLIRGDMDALNITEEADFDKKSVNGNMHACGHDMHTTMLLGAAKLLKDRENEIEGQIKLIFQPGEETLQGATAMIKAGVLQNPKVDTAMMIHVAAGIPLLIGTVIVPERGPSMAGSDLFSIKVQGKGAHGAMPNNGVDPLNVIAHIYLALQEIITREIDALDAAVLTIGVMQGGTGNNIIPDKAELRGSLRTFTKENREFIIKRIKEVSEGIANTFRAEAIVEISNHVPSVINSAESVDFVKKFLVDYFGEDPYLPLGKLTPNGKVMGSEDFAFISQEVPSISLSIMAGNYIEGNVYPLHHPKVKFEDSVLSKGAAIYAGYALEWLKLNKENNHGFELI